MLSDFKGANSFLDKLKKDVGAVEEEIRVLSKALEFKRELS